MMTTTTTGKPAPLELDDLHVAFGGNRVLEGVDLPFKPGFNGLIGPNGAGKTTVFNVLSGYVKPTTGTVRMEGEDLADLSQTGPGQGRYLSYLPVAKTHSRCDGHGEYAARSPPPLQVGSSFGVAHVASAAA